MDGWMKSYEIKKLIKAGRAVVKSGFHQLRLTKLGLVSTLEHKTS